MNIIKPKKLKTGDTITFIAPSGNVDEEKIKNSAVYFEQKGYKVKFGKNIFKKDRYLAGNDKDRLSDLHNAFLDDETQVILCARGGYGALRIINNIDFEIISNNPKIFCGYSDITALSTMILKKTGLETFSSPMPKGDFQPENINPVTENSFFETLAGSNTVIKANEPVIYKSGAAEGVLFGGNLATIASLCGLDFIPDEDFIFFTEDLNEPVYKIDKYLRQLLNIKDFRRRIKAVILGDFSGVDNPEYLSSLFKEIGAELNIPVAGGYPFGHGDIKVTLPIGGKAELRGDLILVNY